ncbi:MAG: hypothetical protein AB4368_16500 [Xenococcaceae cyanobacterium]
MLIFKKISQISLFATTSIVSSFFIANLPAVAATFSFSETILELDNFSISPQNPFADSSTKAVAVSREDGNLAKANAEGSLIFEADSNLAAVNADFYSEASGEGDNLFSFGESSSLAIGSLAIDPNDILSFDFELNLFTFNEVDSLLDASISTFSGVEILLFDDFTNDLIGNFTAINNLDTNLADNVNNDFVSVNGSQNVFFEGSSIEDFTGNIESAELWLGGSFEQSFNNATQVRLEVATLNRSCVQSPLTNDPCTRVPEPDNTIVLLFGFLGLGIISRLGLKIDRAK